MSIREASYDDWDAIWPIFSEVVRAGDTYTYAPDTSKERGVKVWLDAPRKTFVYERVFERKGKQITQILGTYYIKTNQAGGGAHVCNCGYMVSPDARGLGVATLMCEHSQQMAIELGYKAMQFNFVVSSNKGAVRLWHKLGFETVGRLPRAFEHPTQGLVDALVMYKWLESNKRDDVDANSRGLSALSD